MLAKQLYDEVYSGEVNNALLRTVVSRVYYAGFHQLKQTLNLYTTGMSDSHQAVIDALEPKQASRMQQMRSLRRKADYELDLTIHPNDVQYQFELYEALVNSLDLGK